MRHTGTWLGVMLCASLLCVGEAPAVTLAPGDILVADLDAFGGTGGIIKVDPVTGAQTAVASGGFFVSPAGVAIAPSGDLFVADADAFGGNGGVIRVDTTTGAQTIVSSGGHFVRPVHVVFRANGDLLVVDADAFGGTGGIIKVDPVTGAQTAVASGGLFVDPYGITIGPNGDLFATDANAFGGPGGVIRVDPVTGAQTTVTSGQHFIGPYDAAFAPNGDLLVPDPHTFGGQGSVEAVNPVTGVQTTFLTGGLAQVPFGIAFAANGDLLLVAAGAGGIIRVDPVTKAQSILSAGGLFGNPSRITVVPPPPPPPLVVTGAGPGARPQVRLFDPDTGALRYSFLAYDPAFTGGVRVAVGDVNGDGIPDIITGAGPGGGPHVQVFDGRTLAVLHSFFAYDPAFRGGVFVAAGDVNGDGKADIIMGAGPGGGPHVRVLDGVTLAPIHEFFAYDPAFRGGVAVAAGDVTVGGRADIITGPGPGGGPHVRVFDGVTGLPVRDLLAYDPMFTGGVFVAAGDVTGDGRADILTGAGPGGGSHVQVFDGVTLAHVQSFFAYVPGFTGGVTVGAGDVTGSSRADIITGAGPGGGPHVREFDGVTGLPPGVGGSFFAYDPAFSGGVFVAVFR